MRRHAAASVQTLSDAYGAGRTRSNSVSVQCRADHKEIPPVPKKTYQWEDLRRARECGGYPWTHLLKPPLQGDITAEDVLRETTPRRSMSREFSRSRTRSPVDNNKQKILQFDSSPGSSRKHGEEGEDEGVQIPHFSQEVSLDTDGDEINEAFNSYIANQSPDQSCSKLTIAVEAPRNVSPKGILKRRVEDDYYIGVSETREKSKCCHPLVNKIKHLADKTLQKLEKVDGEKSPTTKRKKNYEQEIRQLNSSPGAIRRQKFGAIKLGDSDEMSKTLHEQHPQHPIRKEHIYEDIDQSITPKVLQVSEFSEEYILCNKSGLMEKHEPDLQSEKKSVDSEDPSLIAEDINELKPEDHIMEKLHKIDNITKEALVLEDELDDDEPNVEEVFQNQLDEVNKSNTVVITERTDEESEITAEEIKPVVDSSPSPIEENPGVWSKNSRRWTSEGGTPLQKPLRPTREGSVQSFTPEVHCACQFFQSDSLLPERLNPIGTRPTSRGSCVVSNKSDHEYEIIEKPPPNIVYTAASVDEQNNITKTEDELSSTTSLERKFLGNASFDEYDEEVENNSNAITNRNYNGAETLQKNIEDRYFANTPSTVSRTECDISTSQVDSSALENLPLKRENRNKNAESMDSRIQQKLREGTGKLKTQAGKLKIKLQSIRNKQFSMPERPKFNMPERSKFKMPERPKISLPDRPKFNLPERRKFSLPERPKFKKINISEKLSLGDRKKFTLPDRPKFNMPDLSKIKFSDKPKLFLTNLGKRMQSNPEGAVTNIESQSVEYEVKTYPRLLQRKKKTVTLTSSSPSLNREETPPPVFKFTRKKLAKPNPTDIRIHNVTEIHKVTEINNLDTIEDPVIQNPSKEKIAFDTVENDLNEISPFEQECTHVINEINNDEFFIRPRGISRDNIQVREYLSDEIRQAFNIPKNSLAAMGDNSRIDHNLVYENDEGDPELLLDDTEILEYSNDNIDDKDDGYYTFPPARPSRTKQKKRELESVEYIDEQYSEELEFNYFNDGPLSEEPGIQHQNNRNNLNDLVKQYHHQAEEITAQVSQYPIIDYENSEMEFPDILALQSQTLPMPPRRKRRGNAKEARCSSFTDIQHMGNNSANQVENNEEIFVYRTEHEYIVPDAEPEEITGQSPVAPRRVRNKSRCSQGTSLYDDDRTSHGADSLTLDTHVPPIDDFEKGNREFRQESPGYATVDKTNYRKKPLRRSLSKTPPLRRRKSDTLDRKYYTVGSNKQNPDRPPRKKSSQSLVTLNNSKKISTGDVTQYAEIEDFHYQEIHRELISGEVINKMKDRPLPPPPRPPRESKEKKKSNGLESTSAPEKKGGPTNYVSQTVVETEVSTQTDPLPDDMDFELGMDENLDFSVSSSVREFDEDQMTNKSLSRRGDSVSRPTSRSEKSFKASDPKISEMSKSSWGRTSPTVILVERRVSSPTRINEREEMLTEASLTVQHIDIDESKVSDFPLLPMPRKDQNHLKDSQDIVRLTSRDSTLNNNTAKNIQLETLMTENLHVKDLEVGRLNVSELQANKIKVSDIEGMTLQISELQSKSGHISLSGVEFSQNVIDEIVKKFAAISTGATSATQNQDHLTEIIRPESREEETQTEESNSQNKGKLENHDPEPAHKPIDSEDLTNPPQRPPPPDLTPLLYSYLHDITMPPSSLYHIRSPRERPFTEFHESQHHSSPPPATRRARRKPTTPHSASSSDSDIKRPSSRRAPPNLIPQEPSVSEAGAQFLRVCHNSISRSIKNIFQIFMTYISGTEDKRDVQMALVIFLVLIAGLILFGISDSRTIHHHHWEFFNPPDSKPL